MSWTDRIENTVFTIRTGDGQLFYPDWKSGETSKEFNTSVFDFINQPGSLIDRKKVKSRKFPLVFWFQGDNNIEQSDAFDLAANDPRAWVVRHPFYGDITGQPVSISRNDQNYNCTEINVDFWETIITSFPSASIDYEDNISERCDEYHNAAPLEYEANVNLKPADKSLLLQSVSKMDVLISKGLDAIYYSEYQKISIAAFSAVDDVISAPFDFMYAVQSLVLIPSRLSGSIQYRADIILAIYGDLSNTLLLKPTNNNKFYFEAAAGAAIASLANAFINPTSGDYVTKQDIINVSATLINTYNDYLTKINDAYVSINNPTTAYNPSFNTQSTLQDVVFQTLTSLQVLAFNAKKERIVMLEKDSNLIVLTHKYMGLDRLDANIETFRKINNIKNNYLFLVEKGTQIKYYA